MQIKERRTRFVHLRTQSQCTALRSDTDREAIPVDVLIGRLGAEEIHEGEHRDVQVRVHERELRR